MGLQNFYQASRYFNSRWRTNTGLFTVVSYKERDVYEPTLTESVLGQASLIHNGRVDLVKTRRLKVIQSFPRGGRV